mmetsp:Transcript_19904/g.35340  ORF Transcript_19904/g.35340 Transcript_19904/m.35340 type:complete len:584 (+) Transcript_19904:36-1787(+)
MSAGEAYLDMSAEGIENGLNSNHSALASMDARKRVPVRVCGRIGHVESYQARSIMSLQESLRSQLGMHDECFDFADSLNVKIRTDIALCEALEQGRIPLQATVSDEAVHRIEGRREELAQMQWKVVRDKIQGCEIHVYQLSQQIQDMGNQIEVQHKEHQDIVKALRSEVVKSLEQERLATETGMAQISERVAAISNLVGAEQSKRESAHQGMEHQLLDLRSAIDEEHRVRTSEFQKHLALLEEGKLAVASLEQAIEKSDKKIASQFHQLQAEMAAQARSQQDAVKEQIASVTCSAEELALKMRQSTKQLNTRVGELAMNITSSTNEAADARMRLDTMEPRMAESISNQGDLQQRLSARQEQLFQNFESMRIDKQTLQSQVESGGKNIKELEVALGRCQEDLTKRIDDQVMQLQQDMQVSQRKVITEMFNTFSELELKIFQRLHKESTSRENTTKQIYEEISRASITLKESTESVESTSPQQTPRSASVLKSVAVYPSPGMRSNWAPKDQSGSSLTSTMRQQSASNCVIPPGSSPPHAPSPTVLRMPPGYQSGRNTIGTPQPSGGGCRSICIPVRGRIESNSVP